MQTDVAYSIIAVRHCASWTLSLGQVDHVKWVGELTSSRVGHRYMPIFVLVLVYAVDCHIRDA